MAEIASTTTESEHSESTLNEEAMALFQKSPFEWIEAALDETPQPIKAEFYDYVLKLYTVPAHEFSEYALTIHEYMFEPFEKGKHLTWQQAIVCIAVMRAVNRTLPFQIAIKAGRGTGKSSIMARLLLWFLFSFPESKVPCTAPTADQLFAVLWSEIAMVLAKMKPEYSNIFEWTSGFIRIRQNPEFWFARAKTSAKGETGALSGIHAEYMASFGDEAYDIEEKVFEIADQTQTGILGLTILSGNAVHDHGYFYDCFNKNADLWVTLTMNAEESPIVNREKIKAQEKLYGRNSNTYRAGVLGEFPIATAIDIDGWRRMFNDEWIEQVIPINTETLSADYFDDRKFQLERSFIGVDPAGEGSDEASGYIRNAVAAKLLFASDKVGIKGCASNINGAVTLFEIDPSDISCDNFGVGAELSQEVALLSKGENYINGINVGNQCEEILDKSAYFNERARLYDMMYWWGKRGGRVLYDELLRAELKTIFCKEDKGKLYIMPKKEMRKRGYKSPNRADALMLTCPKDYMLSNYIPRAGYKAVFVNKQLGQKKVEEQFNKHDAIPGF